MRLSILIILLLLMPFLGKAQDVNEYIDNHLPIAKQLMREHNIPASVILGIAIHESAAGKSKVARYLNNHFGIKGKNSNKEIKSSFKDYETINDSFSHFIEYLNSKSVYNKLFTSLNTYDYNSWIRGIHRGGYAASKYWASQVINIIKKNQLYLYDEYPEGVSLANVEKIADSISKSAYLVNKKPVSNKIYTVKRNDNLNVIAKKLNTTVQQLKTKNNLKSTLLKPGQNLKY